MTTPYTLSLSPILVEKVWGGQRLSKLGKPIPPGSTVGESWELADLGAEVAGTEQRSMIASGALAGRTIHDAMGLWRDDLMGDAKPTEQGGFPLLAKYLDAREHLSVQVHPSRSYSAVHPNAHYKTECWTVLQAEPGAELFIGALEGMDRESLAAHVRSGTLPRAMRRIPAVVGQTHLLPSGTIHALGAGIVVAEVQTPSDTTYRLYDWTEEYGRPPRPMHIEQGLECVTFDPPPSPTGLGTGQREGRLVTTQTFTVDELRLNCEEFGVAGSDGDSRPVVLMVLSTMGGAVVDPASGAQTEFRTGSTLLVPASIATRCVIAAGPSTRVLRATVL